MMHLKGIQSKHKVTIAWVLMQCNAIKKKDMIGQSIIEQIQPTSSKGKRVGATTREFIQFVLA